MSRIEDRPRKKKDRFHIEDHEQNRDDKETHRIAAPRVPFRRNAAFIRLQLRSGRSRIRPDISEKDQGHGRKGHRQHGKHENRNVLPRHYLPIVEPHILTQPATLIHIATAPIFGTALVSPPVCHMACRAAGPERAYGAKTMSNSIRTSSFTFTVPPAMLTGVM